MQHYVKDKRVLDLLSYIGGWRVQAAVVGARKVLCVGSSDAALKLPEHNAFLSQVGARVFTRAGEAFQVLKQLRAQRGRFDGVILDLPAVAQLNRERPLSTDELVPAPQAVA